MAGLKLSNYMYVCNTFIPQIKGSVHIQNIHRVLYIRYEISISDVLHSLVCYNFPMECAMYNYIINSNLYTM